MRTSIRSSTLIFLAFLAQAAFAGIRPSFSLDYSSWNATHIVLVTTTPKDGVFAVAESWKGDLTVGERIVVPELRPNQDALLASQYPDPWSKGLWRGASGQLPREPVGSRMVLFLKGDAGAQTATQAKDNRDLRKWKPSDLMDTMKSSVIWIDGDHLYCFEQIINPGPSILSESQYSEGDVRSRVAEIKSVQEEMLTAIAAQDGAERAERLKPFVRSNIFLARMLALRELGKSGPAAVRTILGMLDDPEYSDEGSELVKALVEAGGKSVAGELNRRLQRELSFWIATAPSLTKGWWNQDPTPHAPLCERYTKTFQLVFGLEQVHARGSLDTVRQLRDFWRSLPQLAEISQLPEECDKLIAQQRRD